MVQRLTPNSTLLKALVAVHISYNTVKAHIQQFHQLVSLEPGIIEVLVTTAPYPANEMVRMLFRVVTFYACDSRYFSTVFIL